MNIQTGANLALHLQHYTPAAPALTFDREPWMDGALCAEVDTELFFPVDGARAVEALRVCRACPVRAECLTYALDHNEGYGIWGGLGRKARDRIRKTRRAS